MTLSYDESWGIEILTDDVAEIDEAATTSDGVEIGVGSTFSEHVAQDVVGIEVPESVSVTYVTIVEEAPEGPPPTPANVTMFPTGAEPDYSEIEGPQLWIEYTP